MQMQLLVAELLISDLLICVVVYFFFYVADCCCSAFWKSGLVSCEFLFGLLLSTFCFSFLCDLIDVLTLLQCPSTTVITVTPTSLTILLRFEKPIVRDVNTRITSSSTIRNGWKSKHRT
uniref:Uncharacterized protein n=1 Tax=Cacopsylla melanoneura TaxID=428564 RepID=A0A8D8V999_9HEMI